jgi:hypothetical protein
MPFKFSNSGVNLCFLGYWYTDRDGPISYDGSTLKKKAQISFETSAGVTSRHNTTFQKTWISFNTVERATYPRPNLFPTDVSGVYTSIIVGRKTGWAAFEVLWICVGSLSREQICINWGRLFRHVLDFVNFLLSFIMINLKNSNILCSLSSGIVIHVRLFPVYWANSLLNFFFGIVDWMVQSCLIRWRGLVYCLWDFKISLYIFSEWGWF